LADLYAIATGLVERSAAAFVSGVPEDAADDGLFGPASVAWQVSADLAPPVAGLRALLMQALHPLAMAGVDQHSSWRRDPVGTLTVTMAYLPHSPSATWQRPCEPRPGCGASRIMSAARTRLPDPCRRVVLTCSFSLEPDM
jgi:hypothetical protein